MYNNCSRSKGQRSQGHAQKIYAVQGLSIGPLESKRPLIVVVAQKKLYRQIGVGDSKNVIVFDPLLTAHVIRRMRSGVVHIFNGNQWETLSLITQERIGLGASILVGIIDLGVYT